MFIFLGTPMKYYNQIVRSLVELCGFATLVVAFALYDINIFPGIIATLVAVSIICPKVYDKAGKKGKSITFVMTSYGPMSNGMIDTFDKEAAKEASVFINHILCLPLYFGNLIAIIVLHFT